MENIEFSHVQLSLAREISVSQKNNILTDRIILQISGRKQISAQTVINGTTVERHNGQAQGHRKILDFNFDGAK